MLQIALAGAAFAAVVSAGAAGGDLGARGDASTNRVLVALERAQAGLNERVARGLYSSNYISTNHNIVSPVQQGPSVLSASFIVLAMGDRLGANTFEVMRVLQANSRQGAWSYCPICPPDSDISAYVLRALASQGVAIDLGGIFGFYLPELGAFSTFKARDPSGIPFALAWAPPFDALDNAMLHPEVNNNVFRLLVEAGMEELVNWDLVRDSFAEDGYAYAFYYPSRLYATWVAIDLIAGRAGFEDVVRRAVDRIVDDQNGDGSWGCGSDPWETALAVNTLLAAGYDGTAIERAIDFLIEAQRADGTWSTGSVVWVYPYDVKGQKGLVQAFDSSGILTTALVVMALRRMAEHPRG